MTRMTTTADRLDPSTVGENIDGAQLDYTQPDEISIVISDLTGTRTQQWFGGQVQKIVSVTAAMATAKFNRLRPEIGALAAFDGRTHHLDGADGVLEYLRWRQADAMKNSVGTLASHHFSHRQLTGVPVRERKSHARRDRRGLERAGTGSPAGNFRTACAHRADGVVLPRQGAGHQDPGRPAPGMDTRPRTILLHGGIPGPQPVLRRGGSVYSGFSLDSAMIHSGVVSPVSLSSVNRAFAAAI